MTWKWVIAELVGEREQQRWERRAEEFASQDQAQQWIDQQSDPSRFEARQIAEGTA